MIRPTWDRYWLAIADAAAERSTCSRLHVGALLVRHNRLLSTGFNGAPSGLPHCRHTDVLRCTISEHAERNAVTFAQQDTTSSTLYVTHAPCFDCAKTLINAGVERVVYRHVYRSDDGLSLLEAAGVALQRGGFGVDEA